MASTSAYPLQALGDDRITASFELMEQTTSLTVTPNGCYVLAGFSSGNIRLYNLMSSQEKQGTIIGHIEAKGLHTNLLLHVAVVEDCRFAFAGVLRGSAQMIAWDLSKLPTWTTFRKSCRLEPTAMIDVHYHQEAKLKGFGAVARVPQSKDPSVSAEYRLICGRGIKNIHIWRFCLPRDGSAPRWSLLHDTATNGMSLELVGFRDHGKSAFSRSKGYGLRLWDLENSQDAVQAPRPAEGSTAPVSGPAKIVWKDVPGTRDVHNVSGEFAFGGEYQLSLVKLDAAEDTFANRTEVELPTAEPEGSSSPSMSSSRKRRVMRTVHRVLPTQDAAEALLVCSDGTTLRYNKQSGLLTHYPRWQKHDNDSVVLAVSSVPGNVALLAAHWSDAERTGTLQVGPLLGAGDRPNRAALAGFWARSYVSLWPIGVPNTAKLLRNDPVARDLPDSTAAPAPAATPGASKRAGSPRTSDVSPKGPDGASTPTGTLMTPADAGGHTKGGGRAGKHSADFSFSKVASPSATPASETTKATKKSNKGQTVGDMKQRKKEQGSHKTDKAVKRGRPSLPSARLSSTELEAELEAGHKESNAVRSTLKPCGEEARANSELYPSEAESAPMAPRPRPRSPSPEPVDKPDWPPKGPLPPCEDEKIGVQSLPTPPRVLLDAVKFHQHRSRPAYFPAVVSISAEARDAEHSAIFHEQIAMERRFAIENARFVKALDEALTRVDLTALTEQYGRDEPCVSRPAVRSPALCHAHHDHVLLDRRKRKYPWTLVKSRKSPWSTEFDASRSEQLEELVREFEWKKRDIIARQTMEIEALRAVQGMQNGSSCTRYVPMVPFPVESVPAFVRNNFARIGE